MRWGLLALPAAIGACAGDVGTITLELTTAPGSTVLDGVTELRLTLTHPRAVFETTRGANGFELALEVEATGETGALILEGFEGTGELVATGMSPPFQVGPIDAKVVLYVAAPFSIAPAPVSLVPARREVALAPLPYGAALAGGRDAVTDAASDAIAIYNAYDHSLVAGKPMPAARTGIAIAPGAFGGIYLFGGADATGTETGTLWRFDTQIAPNGGYTELADEPGYARRDERLVARGADAFLVTGAPVLQLSGGELTARTDVAALGPGGTSIVLADGTAAAVFADDRGITRFRDDAFTVLSAAARPGARAVPLPDRTALVLGGPTPDLAIVEPVTGAVTTLAGAGPSCDAPGVAVTTRHLLVSCAAVTRVFDVHSLQLVTTLDGEFRAMTALPNDQVLLVDGAGLQLFTPGPP